MGCNFQAGFFQRGNLPPQNFKRFRKDESYNPESCNCLNQKHLLSKANNKVGTDAGGDFI